MSTSFSAHNNKKPYYKKRADESILTYCKRVLKSMIEMYPYARKHGIRYYFDTDFRRKLSYKRQQLARSRQHTVRRKRAGSFNKSAVKAKIKTSLIDRDGLVCNFCREGFVREHLTIDHIMPLFMGGKSNIENLQLLCEPCHVEKSRNDQKKFVV